MHAIPVARSRLHPRTGAGAGEPSSQPVCASTWGAHGGATLFNASCSSCHGADGSGTLLGKSLKVRDLHAPEVRSMGAGALLEVITKGRGNMPAFGNKLSEADIAKLASYVRTLGRSQR